LADGRWLGFKGSSGEGGSEGRAPRGGGAEEREEEKGGLVRRGIGATLTGEVGSTVHPIRFSNRIKPNQIYFKRIQIWPKL
jgi:hypothetical protein